MVERNTAKVTADIAVNVNANTEFALDQIECMIEGWLVRLAKPEQKSKRSTKLQ